MAYIPKLGVQFFANVALDQTITVAWSPNSTTYTTIQQVFKTTRNQTGQTTLGSTALISAQNFETALKLDFSQLIIVNRTGSIVYITPREGNIDLVYGTTSGNIQFIFDEIATKDNIEEALVRSPKLVISEALFGTTFSSTNFDLRMYEGDANEYQNTLPSYLKSKKKLTDSQSNVWVNVADIAKEGLRSDINGYRDGTQYIAKPLSPKESKWLYVNEENVLVFSSNIQSTKNRFFFVLDGYNQVLGTQNIRAVLRTNLKKEIDKSSVDRIYFKTKNLISVQVFLKSNPSAAVNVVFTAFDNDNLENDKYVQSLLIDTSLATNENSIIVYRFSYGGSRAITVNYEYSVTEECKYEVYDLVFKNRYGVLETLSMSKKLTKTLKTKGQSFLRSIVNANGVFDISKHTNLEYNVSGEEEWTLNTDFRPEYMNEVMTEAMLSESVWLIDKFDNIIPIVKVTDSLQYKTQLNDKLIQYSLVIKMSHNKINNIQ
jgi:hypothetical protein